MVGNSSVDDPHGQWNGNRDASDIHPISGALFSRAEHCQVASRELSEPARRRRMCLFTVPIGCGKVEQFPGLAGEFGFLPEQGAPNGNRVETLQILEVVCDQP